MGKQENSIIVTTDTEVTDGRDSYDQSVESIFDQIFDSYLADDRDTPDARLWRESMWERAYDRLNGTNNR